VDEARALPQFVALALHQLFKRGDFAKLCTRWVGQAGVSTTLLKQVEIPLPPLEEQRRIVAEIEGYQKVLDGARQILAGYRPSFEIDPDWPTQPLGEAATIATGGTPSKANLNFWKGDIPWVSPKDMKTDVILDTEDHVSPEAVEGSATRLIPKGTVLCVVRSGILQHTLPVAITGREVCFNQDINAITANPKVLDAKFLFYLLKTRSAEILRDGIKGGVTVQSFHNGFFKSYEIPLPPMSEQRRLVAELDAEAAQMEAVRGLIPRFEAKIQRVLDRVWGVVQDHVADG
jgi:restriction endonuclease S subunit